MGKITVIIEKAIYITKIVKCLIVGVEATKLALEKEGILFTSSVQNEN